jgi:hypothetical protein
MMNINENSNNLRLKMLNLNILLYLPCIVYHYSFDEELLHSKVPQILIDLENKLFELEGQCLDGIFRKQPMKQEYECFKLAVLQNRLSTFNFEQFDVHIIATFIKEFYRSLPSLCLQEFDVAVFESAGNESLRRLKKRLKSLSQPSQCLMHWLLELLLKISKFEKYNKMSKRNLAIVMTPNLYDFEKRDRGRGRDSDESEREDETSYEATQRLMRIQPKIIEFVTNSIRALQ